MTRFRRLVLELGHGAADPQTIRAAAVFAHLLDAELAGVFVEDETLLHASALPFAREISPLSYQWRPLQPGLLEAALKSAADQARRHLETAAHASGIRRSFEVRRGDIALHVTDICAVSDIVVISAPRRMGAAPGFVRLRETACRSVASVLYLPPHASRAQGPIVAITSGPADPALDLARLIATGTKAKLVVLSDTPGAADPHARRLPGSSAQDVIAVLGDMQEQLIVLTRPGGGEDPGFALAAGRGVPVLVTEPV